MNDKEMLKTVYNIVIIVEKFLVLVSEGKICIHIPVGIGTLLNISW